MIDNESNIKINDTILDLDKSENQTSNEKSENEKIN